MANPVLVIMAAGMGSRYGGLKQIDPIGPNGQILLDYSIYDAHRAGFDRVVFIIRPELHEAFEDAIGKKARRFMQVDYAYQTLDNLPDGLTAPEGREKPLGTAHAVWCAKELTAGCPIAVINADDFYGADAFRKMYDYLASAQDDDKFRYWHGWLSGREHAHRKRHGLPRRMHRRRKRSARTYHRAHRHSP